ASGTFTVAANPADVLPAGQVTLYGINSPIPPDNVEYGSLQVTVVRLDSDGDGVTDFEEDGSPHGGDGNQDGIADRLQSYVASLRSLASLPYVTIEASPQVSLTNVSAVADPAPGTNPSNVDFPLGFFRFDASGIAAGGAATVTIYAQAGSNANTYYGYGPTPDDVAPHWYAFLFDGVTGATVFADRMELHLADGQRGDGDPDPSRISFGPGGCGLSPTPWTNPKNALDVNNDGFVTPADALMMINAINVSGPRVLPPVPAAGDALPPFRDTNWDNVLEATDVLNIVNFLNSTAAAEGEWAGAGEPALGSGLPDTTAWTSQGIAATPLPAVPGADGGRPEQAVSSNRRHLDTLRQTAAQRVQGNLHAASGRQPIQESSRLSAAAMDFDQTLDEIAEDVAQIWGLG
ncbi:MAG TPA: dockerin type I domain-containing protein, partial [Candidatus Anammoximicrobium sp.]|nr:dockerin type I domain-containing protein [Candidatus Anammoximicrobium sp.]